ncbi:hypothetical protein P3T36_004513 [Kitasatospora sp. MAP12-15]|uniref:hypothetical protein n=1 Tax=unclassified Kitasatospora TaxID=2633591 RepID=UPI0024733F0F|nr:hypothetical protein [Kitasatospora sp. MAP12-44]MDH6110940.1 hypothetical protein [Kitasatospora sp. MAP12-44]
MRNRLSGVMLLLLLAIAATGCADGGQLHDAGLTPAVTERPTPQLLWAADATSAPPSPAAPSSPSAPVPLTGITATSDRIEDLPLSTVLQKDPGLSADERSALAGCDGCTIRPAQYRDLTGDGRSELLAALVTPSRAYLHVYALNNRQVLPVLDLTLQLGFTADTVGTDLVVHEPTQATEIISTYQWDGARLLFKDQQVLGAPLCTPAKAPVPTPTSSSGDRPTPAVVPEKSGPSGVAPATRSAAPGPAPATQSTPPPGSQIAVPLVPPTTPTAKR